MKGKSFLLRFTGMAATLAIGAVFAQQASAGCAQISMPVKSA